MKSRLVAIAFLTASLLPSCADDPASILSRKLRSAFGDDAKHIEVRVEGSAATLTGTVSERATQELAEEVARSVPGVTSVENRLVGPEVRGLDKLRVEAVDAALEMAVKGALARDAGSSVAHSLEVEAADGVVSLRGTLRESGDRNRALEVAGRVEGARRVIDLVDVPR